MLCSGCKLLFDQPATRRRGGGWYSRADWTRTLAVIKRNSLSCVACHAMARLLKRLPPAQWDEGEGTIVEVAGSLLIDGPHYYAFYDFHDTVERTHWRSFTLLVEQVKDKGSLDLIARAESTSTNSPDTFAFIKACIKKCQANHKICRAAATQPPWYPTRLIQVEGSQARLIITRDTPPQGPYATLSHCWGGRLDVTQCTSNNLEELKNGIELASLPANFRDAIHATRTLGITYIWIDSLCIMQDSYADRITEVKTMLNVYRQSVLTLAATRAVDSHGGLFAPRLPESLSAGPFRISNGALDGMFVAVEAAADGWYWADVIDGAPLNMRGWVLQERLLSPRIVHFTDDQVIWDCAESTAPEFLPSGAQILPGVGVGGIGPKRTSGILLVSPEKDEALRQWSRIVESYSPCQLSRASDKLLALSGVADSLRRVLGADGGEGGYYVGLWRFQMEIQLCWITARLQGGALPASNQFAPSWSWMSVDGAVCTWDLRDYYECGPDAHLLAQVVSVDMEEPEETGRSHHGSLRLRCIPTAVELETEPWLTLRGATMEEKTFVHLDSADAADTAGPLFFAPIVGLRHVPKYMLGPDPQLEVRGLLLELVGDEATGVYSRRGHVMTRVVGERYYSDYLSDSYLSMLSACLRRGQPASSDILAGAGKVITIR